MIGVYRGISREVHATLRGQRYAGKYPLHPVLRDRVGLYVVRRCGDLSGTPHTGAIPGRRGFAVATCSGGKSEVLRRRGAMFTDIKAPREVDRHILHRLTELVENRGGNRMVIASCVYRMIRGQRNAVNYRSLA